MSRDRYRNAVIDAISAIDVALKRNHLTALDVDGETIDMGELLDVAADRVRAITPRNTGGPASIISIGQVVRFGHYIRSEAESLGWHWQLGDCGEISFCR